MVINNNYRVVCTRVQRLAVIVVRRRSIVAIVCVAGICIAFPNFLESKQKLHDSFRRAQGLKL